MEAWLALAGVVIAAGLGTLGVLRSSRTAGKVSRELGTLGEFRQATAEANDRAEAAEARATLAQNRADALQRRVDELWEAQQAANRQADTDRAEHRGVIADLWEQISWRDQHIDALARHIEEGLPPPPPPMPEGIRRRA